MSLFFKIYDDMKNALRTSDTDTLRSVRMLISEIRKREVDEQIKLIDYQIIEIIEKMVKQCKVSAQQYKDYDRQDLADKELSEIKVLIKYLPRSFSEREIAEVIEEAIVKIAPSSMKDMGKLMSEIKDKVRGRADMNKVFMHVKNILQNNI